MIPHSRPLFGEPFKRAVADVLESGHTASGSQVEALEREVVARFSSDDAAAVDSGTSALMLALRAIRRQRRVRRVGIPAYACRALVHAVVDAGAEPVCMDCSENLRLDPEKAMQLAPQLDAVILVHPFGFIEPMVAVDWPCPVIEDVAQAVGGAYDGRMLGAYGDITVASFYANKPWGGAYGGMVLGRGEYAPICKQVRQMRCADEAPLSLLYAGNHQLSDVHAALVRTRIAVSSDEMARRRKLAALYDMWFDSLDAVPVAHDVSDNAYRYIVRIPGRAGEVIEALRDRGIGAARPVALTLSSLLGDEGCDGAETAWCDCISLPLYAGLGDDEAERIGKAVFACM